MAERARGTAKDATAAHNSEPPIGVIIARALSRRGVLGGIAAAGVTAAAAPFASALARAAEPAALTFSALAHGLDERAHVAPGYRIQVLIRWGDPVLPGAPAFDVDNQSAAAQIGQFGYNCDFVAFLPLPLGSQTSDHGLLCVNHEYTNPYLMFPDASRAKLMAFGLDRARTDIELAAHGHSVIEIRRRGRRWEVVAKSRYNRRISALHSEIELGGPAAGHRRMQTGADGTGRRVQGTLNNCAGGTTPWGTVLIAEENFHIYFRGNPAWSAEARNHVRYGIRGSAHYPWWGRHHRRFDVAKEPNEPNRFGWVVELDPYDPAARAIKRTALGRFKHEAATTAVNVDGRLVVYSGDDENFEYLYRFVSRRTVDPGDRGANRDLLDEGALSVARFSAAGTLAWLPLEFGKGPLTPANGFHGQADVLIETRRAADLMGATPMDRPEDVETNPVSGRVYVVLTNNRKRGAARTDAANPRGPNRDGHILELIPPGGRGARADHAAGRFRWEIFLLAGDPADAAGGARYHPDLPADGWFSSPDNLAFDRHGRMWIATDGSPKRGFADGIYGTETEGPLRALTRQLFRVPRGAEVTGPAFTPDGTTLFAAVQHPGEDSSGFDAPTTRWPDFDPTLPPRPSVVAIRRADGGEIGS